MLFLQYATIVITAFIAYSYSISTYNMKAQSGVQYTNSKLNHNSFASKTVEKIKL